MIIQRLHIESTRGVFDFTGNLKTMLAIKQEIVKENSVLFLGYGDERIEIPPQDIRFVEYQVFDGGV